MKTTPLKIAGLTIAALALTTTAALAGNGKDCNHKKEAKAKTEATSMTKTDVLSTSATTTSKAKMHKVYSVEDAKTLCAKKGAKNMDACVAYKTGKMKKSHAPKT